jgi:hypothetical protein
MLRVRLVLRGAAGALFLAAASYLLMVKADVIQPRPALLASIVVGLLCVAVAWGVAIAASPGSRTGTASAIGEGFVALGMALVAVGGLANWALAMQGFVVLFERQPVQLGRGAALGAFTHGPLADLGELELTLALARLRFEPHGPGGFRAVSALRILDTNNVESSATVERSRPAERGSIFFRQGSFGFAPRISVYAGRTLLRDEWAPLRTIREGPDGIGFTGVVELPEHGLLLRVALQLDSLNEEMKGHPVLELTVQREGKPIGGGTLKPGFSADLEGGYRVVFGGLKRWSEIDITRRSYPLPILLGLSLMLAGALLWPLAAWRGW